MYPRSRLSFASLFTCLALFLAAGGCSIPSFLVTPVSSSTELKEEVVQVPPSGEGSGRKIVILEVEGLLMNARTGGILQPKENDVSLFAQQLDKAAQDPDVVAIVLRINSPGGTVTASDTMYQTLLRWKAKTHKPVVACAQDVAASGAYYLACAADQIVVNPTSVVGSIGVIFETFDVSGTMAKIGVRNDPIKSGPMKDMGSPFKPIGAEERAIMQAMVDEYYQRFRGVVKTGRNISDEGKMDKLADGRVFSGANAVTLGLADRIGLLDDALDLARQLTKSPGAPAVLYKRPYGYGGSIYAASSTPQPQAAGPQPTVLQLNLAPARAQLPGGFYYVWDPGL